MYADGHVASGCVGRSAFDGHAAFGDGHAAFGDGLRRDDSGGPGGLADGLRRDDSGAGGLVCVGHSVVAGWGLLLVVGGENLRDRRRRFTVAFGADIARRRLPLLVAKHAVRSAEIPFVLLDSRAFCTSIWIFI